MIPITGRTSVYALLGHPVVDSPSPTLHNGWFAEAGIDSVYVALPVREPAGVVPAVRRLSLAGANVTVPLKQAVVADLDHLDDRAAAAAAVNTIYRDGDRLIGTNTDGDGLCLHLAACGIDVAGRRAVVIGAGGAGRGIAAALLRWGVDDLRILNRTPHRGAALVEHLAARFPAARLRAEGITDAGAEGAEIVVVCTSARASAMAVPDPNVLAAGAIWYDINYLPPASVGSTSARAAGLRVFDGWGMLCWQAALAFEQWTGVRPRADRATVPSHDPPESC